MKAILFYTTAVMIVLTICSASFGTFLILSIIDVILVELYRKNLTLKDIIKYSGYNIWYKTLKP